MSINTHTISQIPGAPFNQFDRVHMGKLSVAYGAGGSAGAAVTAAFTGNLPPNALVIPASLAGAYVDVSNVSVAGFTLTITPRSGGATLAAGSAGVFIIA